MDLEKQHLAEYGHLRQEILDADKANYQVLGFMLAATGLLFARAFELKNPAQGALVLAILQVFAFPCHLFLRANRRRVWRIATYLRTFVEPHLPGVQWESRLADLRVAGRTKAGSRFATHVINTESFTMLMISFAAIVAETMILACKPAPLDVLEVRTFIAVYLVNVAASAYYLFDRLHGAGWSATSNEIYLTGWRSLKKGDGSSLPAKAKGGNEKGSRREPPPGGTSET